MSVLQISLPRPGPLRLVRRCTATTGATVRHLSPLLGRRVLRRPVPPGAVARALRLTFVALGGTFVKFGQLIGSCPGVFGEEAANEFRACLDTGPIVPFAAIRRTVEETPAVR